MAPTKMDKDYPHLVQMKLMLQAAQVKKLNKA